MTSLRSIAAGRQGRRLAVPPRSLAAALSPSLQQGQAMKIQEVKSPGGMTAWLVEEHSVPLIAHALRLRGRQRAGPRGQGRSRQLPRRHARRGRRRPQLQAVPGAHGGDRHAHELRGRARCLLRQLRDADREPRQGGRIAGAGDRQAALRHGRRGPRARPAAGRPRLRRARPRPRRLRAVAGDGVRRPSLRPAGQRHAGVRAGHDPRGPRQVLVAHICAQQR